MPIKLQVVKENDDADPADYLFEQDRITIGRGSSNDLTLPDQKVSSEHAEVRNRGGTYHLFDRDSKNHTYVDGRRVGEAEPYALDSGDVFQVGDFKIEFAPLFMPSSEQTAHAETEDYTNPFEKHTRQLASALEGIAETYKFAPAEERDESFASAMEEHLDPEMGEEDGVQRLLRALDAETSMPDGASSPPAQPDDPDPTPVLDALLDAVSRMVNIPNHFWREFTGKDLDHPPEKQFLYDADLETLRDHLLGDDLPDAEREARLQHLSEAVDGLVAHNMAMLAGYKKAVAAGTKELLRRVDPTDAVRATEKNGTVVDSLFGGGDTSKLEHLEARWRKLESGEWGELEGDLFRPTYIETYVDRMAQSWDLDKAEILGDDDE
ncbi:MAG: FHA domain-containing protein [Salinivenus sp.]